MNSQRLPVRPKVHPSESLTGYLLRLAQANTFSFSSFIRTFNVSPFRQDPRSRAYHWDRFPSRLTDIEKLSLLTGQTQDQIESMTFTPLYRKLYDSPDELKEWRSNLLASCLVRDRRRFCPLCLAENGILKIEWQVKEIEICDQHHVPLVSTCPICNSVQPFGSESWKTYMCVNNCMDLRKCMVKELQEHDGEYLEEQLTKYDDWWFMLNEHEKLFDDIQGYSKQQSLAIVLLYIAWVKDLQCDSKIGIGVSSGTIRTIKSYVTGQEGGNLMEFGKVLSIVRNLGVPLRTLSQVHVPVEFVNSLFDVQPKHMALARRLGVLMLARRPRWCQ